MEKNELFIVNVYRKLKATEEEQERYNAAIITIAKELYLKNYGFYDGRETFLKSDTKFDNKYPFVTIFYVLIENKQQALDYINSVIKNFRVTKISKVKSGITYTINVNKIKKNISDRKQFTWTWQK